MSRRVMHPIDHLITEPASPALTLDYARRHLKALTTQEDVLIETWIAAATQYVEEQTGRQLITATREAWYDAFPIDAHATSPIRIELPRPPLQSVVSVQYVDGNGDLQPFSDGASPETLYYQTKAPVGPYAERGWVEPITGQTWPLARDEGGAVRIRYICGYGDTPSDVPALLTGVLCALVAHFELYRGAVHEAWSGQIITLPFGVQQMLDGFKYSSLSSTVLRR